MSKSKVSILLLVCSVSVMAETYFKAGIRDVEIVEGEIPSVAEYIKALRTIKWNSPVRNFMLPYACNSHDVEIYIVNKGNESRWKSFQEFDSNEVFVRTSSDIDSFTGVIYVPGKDLKNVKPVKISVVADTNQEQAEKCFWAAKKKHYKRLLEMDIPGAAWFRYQIFKADEALGNIDNSNNQVSAYRRIRRRESELVRSLDLFSGGRAVSENLQLDRQLNIANNQGDTVDISSIEGITTQSIDWKKDIAGKVVVKDFLASMIPEDQHIIIFPKFSSMLTLIKEMDKYGTPILQMVEVKSENSMTKSKYQNQLCLPTSELSKILGPKLIKSVACTGGDPYLRTGSDIAVIFEAQPEQLFSLRAAILAIQMTGLKFPGAKAVSGKVHEVIYNGVKTPDRKVCSYICSYNNTVIVSNSLYQLDQILKTAMKKKRSIADLDEYLFFRDRYKVGAENETAFLMLSDATIRRWCNPKWRIGSSRRTRIAAQMSNLKCYIIDNPELLSDDKLKYSFGTGDIEPFNVAGESISSPVYGSLDFLTPISELEIKKITSAEARAYKQFRDNYQRRWRNFFDPIAVRFVLKGEQIDADISVRPLIADSEYREIMNFTGNSEIKPRSGDLHEKSLIHYSIAVDKNSMLIKQLGGFISVSAPKGLRANPFDWLGKSISLYADDDTFWYELASELKNGERAAGEFMGKNYFRLPVAAYFEVADPLKLSLFMTTLRGIVQTSAPNTTTWENLKHGSLSYVCIKPERNRYFNPDGNMNIYYVTLPDSLIVTLNERVLKEAMDRYIARKNGNDVDGSLPEWKGKSMACRVDEKIVPMINAIISENMYHEIERGSWGNIYILNEWKGYFPKHDPLKFHQKNFQIELTCPAGGEYRWNPDVQSMESTVLGYPCVKENVKVATPLDNLKNSEFGLTFESDGVRVRGHLERK